MTAAAMPGAQAVEDGTPVPRQPRRRMWIWIAVAAVAGIVVILHLTGIVGPGPGR